MTMEKLKKELETSQKLVTSLKAEVEQKEQIAAIALGGKKVSFMIFLVVFGFVILRSLGIHEVSLK